MIMEVSLVGSVYASKVDIYLVILKMFKTLFPLELLPPSYRVISYAHASTLPLRSPPAACACLLLPPSLQSQ